jgi:hypothetical protein
MSGNIRKNQVTRHVTLCHQSTMSGALGLGRVTVVEGDDSKPTIFLH